MATCAALQNQLAPLLRDWDQLSDEVRGDEGDLGELLSEITQVNPAIVAKLRAKLATERLKLKQLDDQIATLRDALEAQGCLIQPQRILDIQYTNPDHPNDVDALYAQTVAFGQQDPSTIAGGKFPSRDAEQEWKQALPADLTATAAHNEDYEGIKLVGATGWVLNPEFSDADVPFVHPFGFDWEFKLALDQPAGDEKRYTFLLTPADQSCVEGYDEAVQQAGDFKDPHNQPIIPRGPDGLPSLLGVEMDGGLVPRQFSDWRQGGVDQGDRMAIFGRWIVDCGHQGPIKRCDGTDVHPGLTAFRTEIHPPLLMAAARVTIRSLAVPAALDSAEVTRVLFTSRPYLVSQRFTRETDQIYEDFQPDDGPFFSHMIKEVARVHTTLLGIPLESIQVEAHPKIKSHPFKGSYEFHLTVRPPLPSHGHIEGIPHGPLAVAFQFTVRSGCSVEVSSSGSDEINILIRLNQNGYTPPPLPKRSERSWSREELGRMDPEAADAYISKEKWTFGIHSLFPLLGGVVGATVATGILERGILTDEYDTSELRSVNILDASHAVSALANNIPGAELQAQLASLLAERDQLSDEVRGDEGDLGELLSEITQVNPAIVAKLRAKLATERLKLKQLDDQIAVLMDAVEHGVLTNDNQPYPVYGWLEVGFMAPQIHP